MLNCHENNVAIEKPKKVFRIGFIFFMQNSFFLSFLLCFVRLSSVSLKVEMRAAGQEQNQTEVLQCLCLVSNQYKTSFMKRSVSQRHLQLRISTRTRTGHRFCTRTSFSRLSKGNITVTLKHSVQTLFLLKLLKTAYIKFSTTTILQ